MHPIPVRTMKFDVPASDEFHPLYIAGNAQLSYQHSATGLYVAHLEPFFVKSLRRVIHQPSLFIAGARDDVLKFPTSAA